MLNVSLSSVLEKILALTIIFYFYSKNAKYGFAVCLLCIVFFIVKSKISEPVKEGMAINIGNFWEDNDNYLDDAEFDIEEYMKKSVIPLNIYQTWSEKTLPPKMQECVDELKRKNPEFQHYLFDDEMCREFIRTNFESDILYAYDKLIPGAYKADLWRYCVLYKNGGIYLDIKFKLKNGFKLLELTDKEYFVLERPNDRQTNLQEELNIVNNINYYNDNNIDGYYWKNKKVGIYNALMITMPNNPVLFKCIKQIVINVKNNYYGYNSLYITGPGLLGEIYFDEDYSKLQNFQLFNSCNGNFILNKKKIILYHYPEYRNEQKMFSKKQHYYYLWLQRKVYDEKYMMKKYK